MGLNEALKRLRGNLADHESQRVSLEQTIITLENDLTHLKTL